VLFVVYSVSSHMPAKPTVSGTHLQDIFIMEIPLYE